jgi:RNA polymerase sigma-70 factor (ECF subfamily)
VLPQPVLDEFLTMSALPVLPIGLGGIPTLLPTVAAVDLNRKLNWVDYPMEKPLETTVPAATGPSRPTWGVVRFGFKATQLGPWNPHARFFAHTAKQPTQYPFDLNVQFFGVDAFDVSPKDVGVAEFLDHVVKYSPSPLDALVENHRAFLRYLERRVGDRELAEDILQDAFIKVMDRPDQAPAGEGLIPWFYRTLRNAAIDRFRRREAASRAVEAFARELETHAAPPPEIEAEICGCITRLASSLKAEYSDALQAVDVQGMPVRTFAEQRGLSASNAGVRICRAREALKKRVVESCGTCAEHGCRDCTCRL